MTTPAHPPLFTPAQAGALLDQLLYEQLLGCVDLDAVYRVEQTLVMAVAELHAMSPERVEDLARSMLERALLRLPDDIRRYLRTGPFLSFEAADRCEETRPDHPAPRRPPSPPPPRYRS